MEMNMKMLQKAAAASTLAVFGLAFAAMTPSPARADTPSRPGNYCLMFGDNETQCDFATLDQCRESASGLAGECYANFSRREDSFAYATRMHGQHR
jgi:hypothetical protein